MVPGENNYSSMTEAVRRGKESVLLPLQAAMAAVAAATTLQDAELHCAGAGPVHAGRSRSEVEVEASKAFDAVLAIDPVDGDPSPIPSDPTGRPDLAPGVIANLDVPFGLIGETTNGVMMGITPACAPLEQNFQTFFTGATGSPWVAEWTIPGADHMDFVWMWHQFQT